MKYIWMMFLGATFICHASELQKHPEVLTSVIKILCNVCGQDIKVTELERDMSERPALAKMIILDIMPEKGYITLRTPEGCFKLGAQRGKLSDLEKKIVPPLEEQYTVEHFCAVPIVLKYKLERKE